MLGAVKLDTIADLYKYGYSGYGIGFDARSQFSRADGSWGKIVVSFGVDNSSFVHVDNKKKGYLSSWWRSATNIRWYYDTAEVIFVLQDLE